MLGLSPLFVFLSLQLMSDVPATVWVMAAVLAAWRSRERPWLGLVAGAALSLAVLVRPTNLLIALPVGLALGWRARRWLLFVLGGLPGAIFLGLINQTAYGSIFTTGYGQVSTAFGWIHVLPTFRVSFRD